jgi:hypothetical protein
MTSNTTDPKREWWGAFLFFTAAACFFVASETEGERNYLRLAAGLLNWVAGIVCLVRMRPACFSRQGQAGEGSEATRT